MKFCSYSYWLNEKFTEDSDPVHDMGIGIEELYRIAKKKMAKNNDWSLSVVDDDDIIDYCLNTCRDLDLAVTVLQYIFKNKIDIKKEGSVYLENLIFNEYIQDSRVELMINLIFDSGYLLNANDFKLIYSIDSYFYDKSSDKRKELVKKLFSEHSSKTNKVHLTFEMIDAFNKKDFKRVKELIKQGADPGYDNYKLLKKAIVLKNKEMVEFFIDYLKKDPNFK